MKKDSTFFIVIINIVSIRVWRQKYSGTTGTALDQIHDRHYPDKVAEFTGEILLVAVTYDRKTKEHRCEIETISHSTA